MMKLLRRGYTSKCHALKLSTNDDSSNPRSQGSDSARCIMMHHSILSCSASSFILLPLVDVAFITSYDIVLPLLCYLMATVDWPGQTKIWIFGSSVKMAILDAGS